MILSSIGCLIYYCLKIRYLLKVNYTISSDTLVEKHSEIHGTRTNKHMYHYFQFNEYFKTNYKDIKVPYYIYKKANSGDKFYLVSSENLKRPFVFDANKYFLEDETVFQDDFMI